MTSDRKSFFEYLGIAHVERIHSQFFAWIFSTNCEAIETKKKNILLQNIFQLKTNSTIINTQTERDGIDILIQTDKEIIVIENKIKSSQHSNQLSRYKEYCDKEFPNVTKYYYFLTLIGETSDDKNWKRISYSNIYKHLKSLSLKPNDSHSVIVDEYLVFLKRLSSIVDDFTKNVKSYDMVFKDGKKKKKDKINFVYQNDNEKFIADNQLETILQKSFLVSLANKVETSKGIITDTRGDALVDFPIEWDILFDKKSYSTIIQLQQDTIKFAFTIGDNYIGSDKQWIEKVIPKMEILSSQNKYGYKKLNKPKSKAYVSISKKLNSHYWHMNLDDLSKLIKTEIENGKSLTRDLIKLIDSN